ncbi:hypothetical protein B0T10DRAFT_414495 [Thelonectria olida]|uniref:RBR-type E3 ubiquitin transferase n=1 Tax=Thelonectria olida TaxID=1576542 RepID=A0A9P9AGF8_9HYPO|nr:hypothetical protein B0T10DRAFT_414495 [Thelonectria olida]
MACPCIFGDKCPDGPGCPFANASYTGTLCEAFATGRCKRGDACPFSHKMPEKKDKQLYLQENDTFHARFREIGGSWVRFGDGAQVTDLTLPSDLYALHMKNLPEDCTRSSLVSLLEELGFPISAEQVKFSRHSNSATIRSADPTFPQMARNRLRTCVEFQDVRAHEVQVPVKTGFNSHGVSCKQVRLSWPRPAKYETAFLYYLSSDVASRVWHNFRTDKYTSAGTKISVRSLLWQPETGLSIVRLASFDATMGVMKLINNLPPADVPDSFQIDQRYLGDMDETSAQNYVKSMLQNFGTLEWWEVPNDTKDERVHATAIFALESQALDASLALAGASLPFLPIFLISQGLGLAIKLLPKVKFEVPNRVYLKAQQRLEKLGEEWRTQNILYEAFAGRNSHQCLVLAGDSRQLLAQAQRDIEPYISGLVLRKGGKDIWHPDLVDNAATFCSLQTVERCHEVAIVQDAENSQLRVFGSEENYAQVAETVHRIIERLTPATYLIPLDKEGTEPNPCTICFCDAEQPIRTRCGHVYCSDCFTNMCEAEASQPRKFGITCLADQCKTVIPLAEISNLLASKTFDNVLRASFASHVGRYPNEFRYCPTPDCTHIYRVSSNSDMLPAKFTCRECLQWICTACHAAHSPQTCAEFQGDASGGIEALTRIREQMGIQNCPDCHSPIEKDGGCNHVTCLKCGIDICWLCLAGFERRIDCNEHMNRLHNQPFIFEGDDDEDDDDDDDDDEGDDAHDADSVEDVDELEQVD